MGALALTMAGGPALADQDSPRARRFTVEVAENGFPTSCEPLYDPIGTWTCYGTQVGDGAATAEGYMVVTTQIFDFSDDGSKTVVTEGFERVNPGDVNERAVVGGTGRWSRARGTHTQPSLGLHPEQFNVRGVHQINTIW